MSIRLPNVSYNNAWNLTITSVVRKEITKAKTILSDAAKGTNGIEMLALVLELPETLLVLFVVGIDERADLLLLGCAGTIVLVLLKFLVLLFLVRIIAYEIYDKQTSFRSNALIITAEKSNMRVVLICQLQLIYLNL